jgi:hypothetical protein
VLQLLHDIARHLEVRTSLTNDQLRDLIEKTDVRRLTDRMEELIEPASPPGDSPPPAGEEAGNEGAPDQERAR